MYADEAQFKEFKEYKVNKKKFYLIRIDLHYLNETFMSH